MLVVSCTPPVSAICSPRLQEKLLKIWHGEPPEEIVENWMAGKLTTVYISPALVEAQPGLHDGDALKGLSCYQTAVGKDGVSTTDYWYYTNKTAVAANYDIVMEVPAIVTVIEPPYSEMHLQVFFMRNGVYGLYECDTYFTEEGSYTAGVMIRVLNYDKNNKLQSDAIQSAIAILNKLNLNDGVVVPTDCP
ncbi:uncharacterized protein LOC124370686 [Homalodisca vitripennis]|uniref:uncharacterized protein LOC124370686 n=1 Tax=Homalodisca vitripennis TaxID=197043 RepID=UPI001EEB408B|nr:uncharacterized protein LOC124370686 [Homalodisca vitripennis]